MTYHITLLSYDTQYTSLATANEASSEHESVLVATNHKPGAGQGQLAVPQYDTGQPCES